MTDKINLATNCPCGSQKIYDKCCGPIISGKKEAPTAESLMRSRYVAFTLADVNYLMRSHHSKHRPTQERKNIEQWAKSVTWMGLIVLSTEAGTITDTKGLVEFRALYLEDGKMQEIYEKSLFIRENNLWVYVSSLDH